MSKFPRKGKSAVLALLPDARIVPRALSRCWQVIDKEGSALSEVHASPAEAWADAYDNLRLRKETA